MLSSMLCIFHWDGDREGRLGLWNCWFGLKTLSWKVLLSSELGLPIFQYSTCRNRYSSFLGPPGGMISPTSPFCYCRAPPRDSGEEASSPTPLRFSLPPPELRMHSAHSSFLLLYLLLLFFYMCGPLQRIMIDVHSSAQQRCHAVLTESKRYSF